MDVLIAKKDVDMLSAVLDYYFDENYIFDYQQGFNIAIAFTAFDGETDWILDDSYGEIVFNAYSWGYNEEGAPFTSREKLEYHVCTPE